MRSPENVSVDVPPSVALFNVIGLAIVAVPAMTASVVPGEVVIGPVPPALVLVRRTEPLARLSPPL